MILEYAGRVRKTTMKFMNLDMVGVVVYHFKLL